MDDPEGHRVAPTAAARYRAEGWWPGLTVPDLLAQWVTRAPDAPGVIAPDRVLSFAELDRASGRVAGGLATLGIGRGDVVSCQLGNVPEFIVLHHAVAKRRAIFNPIHLPYRAAEVEHILGFARTRLMVVGASHVDMVSAIRPRLPALQHVVTADEMARLDGDTAVDRPQPDEPFLLLFTSGTTASPKATLHTHDMRLGNAIAIVPELGLTPDDRVLSIARFSHMWGIMMYWVALAAGAPHVLLPAHAAAAFVDTVERHRATVAVGAPPHVADLLALRGGAAARCRSLRLFALSGSVCPPGLVRRLRAEVGCTPVMLWGMTETGNGIFTRPGDEATVIEETVGRAAPGCEIAIVDDGELAIRSPFMFDGYVDNARATAEAFTADGWFRTGDLATIDDTGNVRILGRRKEQINRGGVKFHPADVEEVVLRHPGVLLAALIGMPDARLGERNCCFVVLRAGATPPALEDLIALCDGAGLAKFKWPERLEIVDALPMTPTGKVQRAVLRDRLTR
ncbi:MAG: AMP-binding protein [Candidatus Rokubacteria bacterium]|nr:AMP-binding protein [Candidatus Rokubacteria bacterium]